jgi:hypothetical protein
MGLLAIISVLGCVALAGVLIRAVLQFGLARVSLPVTASWIEELSVERYRPMIRLLQGEDLGYLDSHPGITAQRAQEVHAQRCRVFREYLGLLQADFRRVCLALRILMAQSREDRPDLASQLIRQRLLFAAQMLEVRARLILYRLGYCRVDPTSLVNAFDLLRIELRGLVPAAAET